jgi:hypothetical protein
MRRLVNPDRLTPPEFTLLAEMTHASLAEFVIDYFIRKTSWVTRAHHLMSIATVAAVVFVASQTGRSWKACLADLGLALIALFLLVLPVHELLTPPRTGSPVRATSAGTTRCAWPRSG